MTNVANVKKIFEKRKKSREKKSYKIRKRKNNNEIRSVYAGIKRKAGT